MQSLLKERLFLCLACLFLLAQAGPVFSHQSLSDEKYPFNVSFAAKVAKAYSRHPEIVKAARLFQQHRWIDARQILENVKSEDMTVLFMKYAMARSFGLDNEQRQIQDILARTPASRLVTFKRLVESRETRAIISHYHRDHLKINFGSLRAQAALAKKADEEASASLAMAVPAEQPAPKSNEAAVKEMPAPAQESSGSIEEGGE